ncbi:hypothetical protein MPTK1_3g05120 [Marchantia polymorpha subsp. ruderalis]|uniref:Uncharacterized protein n=2 Tax=Marchantia polymorpha TaxID=3197 RepID=A0AAF6AXK8_MARPO|nr:hypothetical protein MARPO_0022s0016 [Marchantia polymorpha]BBN04492.1 hypothetical protein Mp_3g05120 [Marchantia polymorpha subsp. ruderalis]|eukprot:PTQ43908.1 hypothetical protein MARPO_0022s0016 [Marchantia polymorpha]
MASFPVCFTLTCDLLSAGLHRSDRGYQFQHDNTILADKSLLIYAQRNHPVMGNVHALSSQGVKLGLGETVLEIWDSVIVLKTAANVILVEVALQLPQESSLSEVRSDAQDECRLQESAEEIMRFFDVERLVDTFKTEDDKYERFKDILDTHSNGQRDFPAVVAHVESLFGGTPHLTLGFERVLHGVALLSSILSAEKLFSVNVIDALTYVRSVIREKAMYRMFLELLKDYNTGQIDVTNLISQVKVILDGHPNLIADFHKCLPGIPHLSDLLKDN